MRPRGAILLAVLTVALPAGAAVQGPSEGESAIAELKRQALDGAPRCAIERGTITYVGPTDAALVDCLERHPAATTLRITSLGGPVAPAIAAARIVATRRMAVSVAGFCGSSCGNYIAAAARRLDVLEDSAIMLHGAPLADAAAQRDQAIAALEAAGNPRANMTVALIDAAVAQLREQRRLHDRFAADFAVGAEWYDLTAYYRALERLAGRGPMLIVSPSFARACLGHPEIGDFWRAETDEQRERMRRLLGGELMFMGADLPTPASCGARQ